MRPQGGATALLCLVVLAVICVVGGWSMTFVRFHERLNMAKTNAHFVGAIRYATLSREKVESTEGDDNAAGNLSASQWAAVFNSQTSPAPNGGPAFIVNNLGSRTTGAVGVAVNDYGAELHVVRPSYLALAPNRAVIRHGEVEFNRVR